MRIGKIGAGQIAGTLTRRLTTLGHQVIVANSRDPETLQELATATGATAVWAVEAVRDVDLVVVTISEKRVPELPPGLFADALKRLVVVDTGNYYPRQRDNLIAPIEGGVPESVWVEQQLGRPVVKAFNNVPCRTPDGPRRARGAARTHRTAGRGRRPGGQGEGHSARPGTWVRSRR